MADAIGNVVGAFIGADASRSAANKQADAAAAATQLQKYQYDTTRADQAPWRQAGENALGQLSSFQNPSLNPADVMSEPGYQFGLTQGLDNVQNTAAAKGGLYSGNALKALTQYGNDYASTKYNDAWNRMQSDATSRWNRLAGLAGVGQSANNAVQAAGANYANQAGNLLTSNANAQGAAGMAGANIWGNAINSTISAGNRNNWWQSPSSSGSSGSYGIDPYGQLGGAATAGDYSDRRLKTDIQRIDTRPDGLGVYAFRYVWGGPMQIGLMADEVKRLYPDAVSEDGAGFQRVHYARK